MTRTPRGDDRVPCRILGIDGGSRWIGYAVTDDGAPAYWGTLDCWVRSRGTTALRCKVRTVVGRLLRDLRPEVVAIEEPTNGDTPRMRSMRIVLDEIERLVRAAGARLVWISPKTARLRVVQDGWATKDQVATALALRFPELRSWLLPRKSAQIARYAHHSSDALCIALAVDETRVRFTRRSL